jgi:AraC-like DNA-binding protein
MIYPVVLFLTLCGHIRKYRQWCEDNFSTLEDIDVQWIVRYLTMLAIVGLSFYFIVFWYVPNRMFTQQWMFLLIFSYTTERVLYRPDPWKQLRSTAVEEEKEEVKEVNPANNAYRATLEAWLEKEKPYLNPDFQLQDLRQVLPMNRTYLSQFINAEYGCSFYHWVNGLRIAEAKRLLTENPEMKMKDIAQQCGFSSPTVFTRVFTRETGIAPSEWK